MRGSCDGRVATAGRIARLGRSVICAGIFAGILRAAAFTALTATGRLTALTAASFFAGFAIFLATGFFATGFFAALGADLRPLGAAFIILRLATWIRPPLHLGVIACCIRRDRTFS